MSITYLKAEKIDNGELGGLYTRSQPKIKSPSTGASMQ